MNLHNFGTSGKGMGTRGSRQRVGGIGVGSRGLNIGNIGWKELESDDSPPRLRLTDNIMKSLRIAKLIKKNSDKINQMDFFVTGEWLASSADDGQVVLYDCNKGIAKSNQIRCSKTYGATQVQFTHTKDTVIHGSTKTDDCIRCLSVVDNKYIRLFKGHTKQVTTVRMSRKKDTFLSTALDKQLRLWDVRSPNCQGLMSVKAHSVANFDPEGLIFAVGYGGDCVQLFDIRTFDKGAFANFKCTRGSEEDGSCDWTNVKFSPDGKMIMLSSNSSAIKIIDAFRGTPVHTFAAFTKKNKTQELLGLTEASFSPDSRYVFCGASDGNVHVWDAINGTKLSVLSAKEHSGPVGCVQFNPKYMLLATAYTSMAFWVPTAAEG